MRLWPTITRRLQGLNRLSRLAVAVSLFASCALMPGTGEAQPAGYWHTNAEHILDEQGQQVHIHGISWYGFETSNGVVGGLYAQDYKKLLSTLKSQGFNTIRIPYSSEMVETPSVAPNIAFANKQGPINIDLHGLNSLEVLDQIVVYASRVGLRIILDHHRSESGNTAEANGLWYTSEYPESSWLADWVTLAYRYRGDPTVIGFDLHNEPHSTPDGGGACWDCGGPNDWHLAAEHAGNVILDANPKLLIFVEGVDKYNGDSYWWGGNLEGVATSPVVLRTPGQLVYSAHDYGPHEQAQRWFNGSTTPSSLASVWTKHWAYISQNHIAPVYLGEFGTTNTDQDLGNIAPGSQGQWFSSLVDFLNSDKDLNWGYWAVNGEDHYGLFSDTYRTDSANESKVALLRTGHPSPPFFSLARLSSALLFLGGGTASLLSWLLIGASGMTVGLVYKSRSNKHDEHEQQESV
jgi:endoglucanase